MFLVSLFRLSHGFHTPDGRHDIEMSPAWATSSRRNSRDELRSLRFTGLSFTFYRLGLSDAVARCDLSHYRGTRAGHRVIRQRSTDVTWLNDPIQHITTVICRRRHQPRDDFRSDVVVDIPCQQPCKSTKIRLLNTQSIGNMFRPNVLLSYQLFRLHFLKRF